MIKRIFGLVVISSLISAGLLFLGTTLMGKFLPRTGLFAKPPGCRNECTGFFGLHSG